MNFRDEAIAWAANIPGINPVFFAFCDQLRSQQILCTLLIPQTVKQIETLRFYKALPGLLKFIIIVMGPVIFIATKYLFVL